MDFSEISFIASLKGTAPNPYYVFGSEFVHEKALTETDNEIRNCSGNRVCLTVNSLTGSGDVIISGTYVDCISNCPIEGTETITVDTGEGQNYISTYRFIKTTAVTIPNNISAIDYDISTIGMYNRQSTNIEILGLRCETLRASGKSQSIRIRLWKLKDDGNKKLTKVPLEDILIDTSGITDNMPQENRTTVRTASSSFFEDNQYVLFDTADYSTYFVNAENGINSHNYPSEGYIMRLDWTKIDVANIILRTRRQ